jgi:hypothetical protein
MAATTPDEIHQHKPPAVVVPPQLDPDLLKADAGQIALADAAAGSLDADTVLSHDGPFLHEESIGAHVRRAQREAGIHRSDALTFGRALEDGVITGAVADERSIGAGEAPEGALDRVSLFRIDDTIGGAEQELLQLETAEAEIAGHLSGETTDASGVDLSAPIPKLTARQWKIRKWISKLFMLPFEALFLYFTLRLTVNSEGRGIGQLVSEWAETIAVVGLSLIIVVVAPSLLADRVARLKRWQPADEAPAPQQRIHDRIIIGALLAASLGLALLLAWLRAAFLSGAITEDSTIVIPYLWFLLIAVVWVVAPSLFVYVLSRANSYWNHYIPDLLTVREEIAAVRARLSDNRVARADRLLRHQRQQLITQETLQGWDAYRDEILPAAAAEAQAEYLDQLVRAVGDPKFTDAVQVNLEGRVP